MPSPHQLGKSLSKDAEKRLRDLTERLIAEVPAEYRARLSDNIENKLRSLVEQIAADISAEYKTGLTEQVALLHIELEEEREKNKAQAG